MNRLTEGILHANPTARVYVLTDDMREEFKATKLRTIRPEWTTWWAKMELFRPDLLPNTESILYFDLDTVICGDISTLLRCRCSFAGLADFYKPTFLGSGVLLFNPKENEVLWDRMNLVWPECISKSSIWRGDQDLIQDTLLEQGRHWVSLQNRVPGIVSFKKHIRGKGMTGKEKVVCFHGKPRPADIAPEELISKYWRQEWPE